MKKVLTIFMISLAGWLASETAMAATSADATIFNRATLSFDGGADVTVGVGVKVGLVGAAPTLNAPGDDAVVSGNTAIFTYTIFSNATGLDTYNLTAASVDSGVNPPGVIIFKDGGTPITSIVLGASITGGANSLANTVEIPAGSEVNLVVGMDIRLPAVASTGFAGGLYNIDSIANGIVKTVTINESLTVLNLSALSGPAIGVGDIPAGTPLGEEKTFTMEVPGGSLTAPPAAGTHTVTLTATGVKVPPAAPLTTTDDVIVTVTAVVVTMTKSVAIVDTSGAACTATNGTVGTFAFFPTVLDVDSGDCVIYKILVSPAAGQPALTTAIVADVVPEHTAYVSDSLHLNTVQVSTILGADGGTLPLAAGTFQVNSPASGLDSNTGNDGDGDLGVVDAGASAELTFRAVVGD